MGTKRFIIASLLSVAIAMPSMAQLDLDDDVSNFGLWTSVGVEKKINKKWGVELEGEFRTADALNEVARYSVGISTDYKICSWLKANVGYIFLRDYSRASNTLEWKEDILDDNGNYDYSEFELDKDEAYWRSRHRFNVSLTGSVKLNRFKLSLRERWQYTYQPEFSYGKTEYEVYRYNLDYWAKDFMDLIEQDGYLWQVSEDGEQKEKVKNAKGQHVLRSRLQVEYDIKGVPFEPYASVEMYNDFDGFKIKKMRYTIGGDYKINKKHSIGLYYRYQDFPDKDDDESTHILGVGYKFKF